MKKSHEDIAKFITDNYGNECLFEFKKSSSDQEFSITKSEKTKDKKLLNCEKCHKLIISLRDKRSYYLNNKCDLCSQKV